MRNNKGITLIALVITIIVLLILAGITIAMLTGDNGLLTKANEAKITDLEASATEKVNLAVAAANLELQTQLVTDSSFDPRTDSDDAAIIKGIIAGDLKPDGDWQVDDPETTGTGSAAVTKITVTFKNQEYHDAKGANKVYTVTLNTPSSTNHNGITVQANS